MDMPRSSIQFTRLGTTISLETTSSNHMGFYFWTDDAVSLPEDPDLWDAMDEIDKEVIICEPRTEGSDQSSQNIPEPYQVLGGQVGSSNDPHHVNTVACSRLEVSSQTQNSELDKSPANSALATCPSHDFHVGTETQAGVRVGHCGSHVGECPRSSSAFRGQAQRDLDFDQASQGQHCAAPRLEEIRPAESQELVRGVYDPGFGASIRWPLDSLASGTAHHGAEHVGARREGGDAAKRAERRFSGIGDVSQVHHPFDSAHQQGEQGDLSRMHPLPRVPSDHAMRLSGSRCEGENEKREDGRGVHETHQTKGGEKEAHSSSPSRLGRFLDACAVGFRGWRHGHPRGTRGSQQEHQPDRAGSADHQGSSCQGSAKDQGSSPGREELRAGDPSDRVTPLSQSEIRDRIQAGRVRREYLKKGVMRRCYHNAKQILLAMCLMTSACVGSASASACKHMYNSRPDCLEIFSGSAEISWQFSSWGWTPLEPIDIQYGMDLYVEDNRERVLHWIRKFRPRLVIVSYPCKWWSPINHIACSDSQAKRRLEARRRREKPLLELCEKIFDLQLQQGGDALGENPLSSVSFVQPPISRILSHPAVYSGVSHGCRLGIKHVRTGEPLKKPTLWFSTSPEICDELSVRCWNETVPGHHTHGLCLGGADKTAHAGKYTEDIAKAVHRGYVRMLKRKEPGRIRHMLRVVGLRIKQGGPTSALRWSEKSLKKAIDRWNAVFAVQSSANPEDPDEPMPSVQLGDGESGNAAEGGLPVRRSTPGKSLAAGGIRFEVPPGRKLSDPVRQSLCKIHCNLGHPSKADMLRFLKLGGVTGEVLEAIEWMKCITCSHARRPSTHRNVSMPPHQVVFGDEVQLDCFKAHDATGRGQWFLSILDRATSYHVVTPLSNHSPKELYVTFRDNWITWAGPPNQITVDREGGFAGDDFWDQVGKAGSLTLSIAGTAHWQAGKIERHNQMAKDILQNVINHTQAKGEEAMKELAIEVSYAKNSLVREHGWSPVTLVFGKEPRVFGELIGQGNPITYHPDVGTPGSEVARRMRFRYHAKMEYIKAQAKQMLGRAVHARTRKIPTPRVGQRVFFWREDVPKKNRQKGTKWQGPGCIVGFQGSNAWVAVGGRCMLVASEHLREVEGDERFYGEPDIQKSIALFKGVCKGATYDDLTKQKGPDSDVLDIDIDEFFGELDEGQEPPDTGPPIVPGKLVESVQGSGWGKDDFGNPVLVSKTVWAYRTPTPKYDPNMFPFRSTWAYKSGSWIQLEKDVRWVDQVDPHALLPCGPVSTLVTVFCSRTRRQICEDSVPWQLKKKPKQAVADDSQSSHNVHVVESKNRLKKMLDKEIPWEKIPDNERVAYQEAIAKEWSSWLQYESCEVLSVEESQRVQQERPDRVLPSRFVLRNKNAGLMGPDGTSLPLKPKARLCLAGHLCPDSMSGELQLDSPTVERVSTMLFLHTVVSNGWIDNWFVGDISNAFLQGAPLEGKDMFMKQPKQGLPGLLPGQILKLRKSVYGRPDAPRAWYNELARVLEQELGFVRSAVDPAAFYLRDPTGKLVGMMIIHVDDLMIGTDQGIFAKEVVQRLHGRFPFGTWQSVAKESAGVSYCGKEIKVKGSGAQRFATLSQQGFVDGRLGVIQISKERARDPDARVSESERTDFRSCVGSLQWLASQSRPDVAFEVNQLQKRVGDLRVGDLIRANKCVKEVVANPFEIEFHDLGTNCEVVVFHDASLFNSVGVEISDKEADDILLTGREKKLVYSQKGAVVGMIRKGDMDVVGNKVRLNIVDWKSTTNKRVVESSLSAETHAAISANGLGRFVQALVAESRFGPDLVTALDEEDWQDVVPLHMITDCKSIYDHIRKDGHHVSDKGSIIQVLLLRKMCSIKPGSSRAQLWWVPTRHQLADFMTKAGKGKAFRDSLGWAQFHEMSAAKSRLHKTFKSEKNRTSVNFQDCN